MDHARGNESTMSSIHPHNSEGDGSRGIIRSYSTTFEDILQNDDIWNDCLLPFLRPIDLICLTHVSKRSRRVSAQALNQNEISSIYTLGHLENFRDFLRTCSTVGESTWKEMVNPHIQNLVLPGPLRLERIETFASTIEQRFAILHHKESYYEEETFVALFNEHGEYLGYYQLQCTWKNLQDVAKETFSFLNNSMPTILMRNTRNMWAGFAEKSVHKWGDSVLVETDHDWKNGWFSRVVLPHFALVDSFKGTLSPTEAFFVLMHALSSNIRVIHITTTGFIDNYHNEMTHLAEGHIPDVDTDMIQAWIEDLAQFSISFDDE